MVDTAGDESLPRLESRVAALLASRVLPVCRRTLCGHGTLLNMAMGLAMKPRCASCLAEGMAMTVAGLRDHLWAHFQRRACYGEAWRRVSERASFSRTGLPACLWPDAGGAGVHKTGGLAQTVRLADTRPRVRQP